MLSITLSAWLSLSMGYLILVARVKPRPFQFASLVNASCLPPMYTRAVSTSL